jgi:hypothetical protein
VRGASVHACLGPTRGSTRGGLRTGGKCVATDRKTRRSEEREMMMDGRQTRSLKTPRRTIQWTISKVECSGSNLRIRASRPNSLRQNLHAESTHFDSVGSVGRLDLYVDFCS